MLGSLWSAGWVPGFLWGAGWAPEHLGPLVATKRRWGPKGGTREAAWTPGSPQGAWGSGKKPSEPLPHFCPISAPFLPRFVLVSPRRAPFSPPGRREAAQPQHRGLHVGEVTVGAPRGPDPFPAHLTRFQQFSGASNPFPAVFQHIRLISSVFPADPTHFPSFPADLTCFQHFFFLQNNLVLAFSCRTTHLQHFSHISDPFSRTFPKKRPISSILP